MERWAREVVREGSCIPHASDLHTEDSLKQNRRLFLEPVARAVLVGGKPLSRGVNGW